MRIVSVMFIAILLSSCNTVSGIGQDMRGVGDALTNSSNRVKRQF